MEGLAVYDFQAREEDELTVFKGDRLNIIEKYDDGWWLVEYHDQQGVVPSNYLKEFDPLDEPAGSARGNVNCLV